MSNHVSKTLQTQHITLYYSVMSSPERPVSDDLRLQADIDALRPKFENTQDLYREVCAVMFFRYGITPTANKLYQLVRKGSMSAPAEALARFWENLRDKSRVRIEHPDLPESLRDAAGELTAKLWQQARELANETTADFVRQARQDVLDAALVQQAATQERDAAKDAEAQAEAQNQALQVQIRTLEQRVAHDQGLMSGLEQQIEQIKSQCAELASTIETFKQSEQRLEQERQRLLVEIDRERGATQRAQKELDAKRVDSERAAITHLQKLDAVQQQLEESRQHAADLQVTVARLSEKEKTAERALPTRRRSAPATRLARKQTTR